MKATSLLSIRSWLSKIHPPLPRSQRESQQLLTLLTTSFQRELDEAHPTIESRNKSSPRRSSSAQPSASNDSTQLKTPLQPSSSTSSASRTDTYNLLLRDTKSNDVAHAIRNGANDLPIFFRFLNAKSSKKLSDSAFNTSNVIATWFQNASTASRASALRTSGILAILKQVLATSKYITLLWDEVERLIEESPHVVTLEEAQAISLASMSAISVPARFVPTSADRFVKVIGGFRDRRYKVNLPASGPDDNIKAAFHPLTDSLHKLALFVIAYPETHGLDSRHFDALLSLSDLWRETHSLNLELVQALHPTNPDHTFVIKAVSNPNFRISCAIRLTQATSVQQQRFWKALLHVRSMLSTEGRDGDAALITAFYEACRDTYDVQDLRARLIDSGPRISQLEQAWI